MLMHLDIVRENWYRLDVQINVYIKFNSNDLNAEVNIKFYIYKIWNSKYSGQTNVRKIVLYVYLINL